MKLNNETIREAVKLWLEDEAAATKKYGFINDWDTSQVTDMSKLFLDAHEFNSPIGSWDVSNVKTMFAIFYKSKSFNKPLNNWDVSKVINMNYMFNGSKSFNQPLNKWNVGNVTSMESMFKGTESFNQPLDSWDVSNVVSMDSMFYKANSFNQPINNWDVSKVTNMSYMFYNAKSFNQPLDKWDICSIKSAKSMFAFADSFTHSLESWILKSEIWLKDALLSFGLSSKQLMGELEDMDERRAAIILKVSEELKMTKGINKKPRKYLFDGWDQTFIEEQIEEEPIWYENNHNGETLSMFLSIINIHFSQHPKINELCYQVENNYIDFIKLYRKCFQVKFNIPKELEKHISLKNYDLDLTQALHLGKDYLIFDTHCNLTFEIKTNYTEATSLIDEFQKKNHDLRWNISVYWSDKNLD